MEKVQKAVLVASEIAATAVTVYIAWRLIVGPDGSRRVYMRVAKAAENRCMRNAQTWADLADKAQRAYDAGRGGVTV